MVLTMGCCIIPIPIGIDVYVDTNAINGEDVIVDDVDGTLKNGLTLLKLPIRRHTSMLFRMR